MSDDDYPETPDPGWAEKANGMALALANEAEAWKKKYRELAEQFLQSLSAWSEFNGEHLTEFALRAGLGNPHTPECWGANSHAVLSRWLKDGRVVHSNTPSFARKRCAHGRRYPTYMKVKL
jgi:uncharacterized protein YaeQ